MDYAVEMTSTPVEVPDELFAALQARLDEAQLLELTSAIGWENYRARTAHALEIGPAGFTEGVTCAVPYREAARPVRAAAQTTPDASSATNTR